MNVFSHLTPFIKAICALLVLCVALAIKAPDTFPHATNLLNVALGFSWYAIAGEPHH